MRAIAIPKVEPLDLLLPTMNERKSYLTIAVGDGRNEAEMGNIAIFWQFNRNCGKQKDKY
jgi:hypothetical protein